MTETKFKAGDRIRYVGNNIGRHMTRSWVGRVYTAVSVNNIEGILYCVQDGEDFGGPKHSLYSYNAELEDDNV